MRLLVACVLASPSMETVICKLCVDVSKFVTCFFFFFLGSLLRVVVIQQDSSRMVITLLCSSCSIFWCGVGYFRRL